jgi:hypothetical protein
VGSVAETAFLKGKRLTDLQLSLFNTHLDDISFHTLNRKKWFPPESIVIDLAPLRVLSSTNVPFPTSWRRRRGHVASFHVRLVTIASLVRKLIEAQDKKRRFGRDSC